METQFEPSLYGRYVLLNKIAAGGMAEVFRAKSYGTEDFEKLVAIKRLYPHLCQDQSFVKMFINEAKLAATLNHVNIAPIFDFGRQQGLYYIAMEYVRGCDLADLIQRCRERHQPLPLGLAIWLLIEICNGLDYAHRKHDDLGNFLNLIHRDVTPQNILISYEGEVKIADFGIAKVQMLERDETTGGILKGKFSYMSPEQVRGERMDHRSDIFSLGIVAWELLTCQKMFDGPNDYHILEKVREALFIPPRQINPDLPPALEDIIMKALTRSPSERYSSVGEIRLALLRLLSSSRLFPSRAHLSAFVRKLFQDKLQTERGSIITETQKAREIWHEHHSQLGLSPSLMSSQSLPALPAIHANQPVEVLASAPNYSPPVNQYRPPSPTPPTRSVEQPVAGNQFPVAALPASLDLDGDEDPTLPDILDPAQDELTANMVRAPQPIFSSPPPSGFPPALPSSLGAAPSSGAPPADRPLLSTMPGNPIIPVGGPLPMASGPFQAQEESEFAFQPGRKQRNLSLILGVTTFVVGVVIVFVFSQWLLPANQGPQTHQTNPPAQRNGLAPNQTQHNKASFAPPRIVIQSKPWAYVYLNGTLLQTTPVNRTINPGRYTIVLHFPNLSSDLRKVKKAINVELKPGQTFRYSYPR